MELTRTRPIKMFVVLQAYGAYHKGDRIQPTGLYRDMLLRKGLIAELKEDLDVIGVDRLAHPPLDRMIHMDRLSGTPPLNNRKVQKR